MNTQNIVISIVIVLALLCFVYPRFFSICSTRGEYYTNVNSSKSNKHKYAHEEEKQYAIIKSKSNITNN